MTRIRVTGGLLRIETNGNLFSEGYDGGVRDDQMLTTL
jgi:hypothetical protein